MADGYPASTAAPAPAPTTTWKDKARARASHERIHAAQQEDKRALRAHRRESETIGHYGTAHHHGARTEIRMSRKFYADRAASASTRRRRNDDRRLEALAAVEVRRPRSYRLRIDPPPQLAAQPRHHHIRPRQRHPAVSGQRMV